MRSSDRDYRNRRGYILCDLIFESGILEPPIRVLDIGARDAFADPRWTALPPKLVELHGFEPDDDECAALNSRARREDLNFHFHSVALASREGTVDFHKFVDATANSIYPPNEKLIRRWSYRRDAPFAKLFRLVEKTTMPATTIDKWAQRQEIREVDFCKLNVQGAELDILKGAGKLLPSVTCLVVEQSFSPTYIGAPLFGEVYEFLRNAGFVLYDIIGFNFAAKVRSPIYVYEDAIFTSGHWPRPQLFEGHFLYFRDLLETPDIEPGLVEKCLKLACLAEVFGQIEYSFELLDAVASSAAAGDRAAVCRRISEQGAAKYRELSKPLPLEVPARRLISAIGNWWRGRRS